MRLHFVGNILSTNFKLVGSDLPDYQNVLVDTGAFKTGLPFQDCISQTLQYRGLHSASGLFGSDVLPLFRCTLEFETGDSHELEVLGLPLTYPLIGRDILSKYEFTLDWMGRTATARRTSFGLPR